MCFLTVLVKFGQFPVATLARNSSISQHEIVRASTFEQKIIETWL